MKIQLSKDTLFTKQQPLTLGKDIRSKQRQKLRIIKNQKFNRSSDKSDLNIEVIDPLPQQLKKYRDDIEYKRTHQSSKASHLLKKYILEQQRNLKRIRLDRIQLGAIQLSPERKQLRLDMEEFSAKSQKSYEEIEIPLIEEVFKNQQRQYVLFEGKIMRDQLKKAYNTIQDGVKYIKSYHRSRIPDSQPSNTHTRRGSLVQNVSVRHSYGYSNPEDRTGSHSMENQYEIDHIIERKLTMSKKLRDRLYNEKKQMMSLEAKESSKSKSLNFYIPEIKKPKKKIFLEGVKPITYEKGTQKIKVTPASTLLFSLNKMSIRHQQKQQQLSELLQNSYQNRLSNLSQKSDFYQQESPFTDLSTSNQFRLRKLMDRKLLHRLQLSKQQINKFCQYLNEIKGYHCIINDQILEVLKEVRVTLLSGKVMKLADLDEILKGKDKRYLVGHPNQLIIQKLSNMMI